MVVYTFDRTLDGLLTAVYDAYALHQQPELLLGEGGALPLFVDAIHPVTTADDKARRVWSGLEKRLSKEALRLLTVSWLSEVTDLDTPLFHYIYKVFQQPPEAKSIERNFTDPDVKYVTDMARRVMHEQLRIKQFVRFQKAKDGTYLAVVSPDHNVLPLVTSHFEDRFRDQSWLIYDAKRHRGYYHEPATGGRFITFVENTTLPFDLHTGQLAPELLSENDQVMQELWRTYFKAICIKERLNPRKQLKDMPRRYWRYMTEKQ